MCLLEIHEISLRQNEIFSSVQHKNHFPSKKESKKFHSFSLPNPHSLKCSSLLLLLAEHTMKEDIYNTTLKSCAIKDKVLISPRLSPFPLLAHTQSILHRDYFEPNFTHFYLTNTLPSVDRETIKQGFMLRLMPKYCHCHLTIIANSLLPNITRNSVIFSLPTHPSHHTGQHSFLPLLSLTPSSSKYLLFSLNFKLC